MTEKCKSKTEWLYPGFICWFLVINDPYVVMSPGFGFQPYGLAFAILHYLDLKSKLKISLLCFTKVWILKSKN
ncbi:MAG TPA: hypothetical protein VN414_11485 [Methanosarcina sp.]|nr:hypothetical protein [Methanosarcina sp.]